MSEPVRGREILQSDPGAGYRAHREAIDAALARVLERGRFVLGEEVERLEAEIAAGLGVAGGVGVASGTDALELALRASGVGPGDGVVTVAHTAVATVAAIERCGAIPVLVDIDPRSFTLDPARLSDLLSRRGNGPPAVAGIPIRAVVPVHLYGHPADLPAILDVAREHGLVVVEDCAQAHGAAVRDRPVGGWGDAGALSFYPTKNLGALGDGGMVVTDRPEIADRVRRLRQYGWGSDRISETSGFNSRLDELQAAVLRAKLPFLAAENERRRAIARTYSRTLAHTSLGLPRVAPTVMPVFHQYVVRSPSRDALRQALARQGIQSLVHYPVPVHLQPAYRGRLRTDGPLTHTEAVAGEVLSLPMHPHLDDDQVGRVCAAIELAEGSLVTA